MYRLIGRRQSVFNTEKNCGYWKVEIDGQNLDENTFTSDYGVKRFICMPFGLKNMPDTFQGVRNVILWTARCQYELVYLDDIVVFSKSVE